MIGLITAVDFKLRNLGKLEKENCFSSAEVELDVAAGVTAQLPAVRIGRLKAARYRTCGNGLPNIVIITDLQFKIGRHKINTEHAGRIHGKGSDGFFTPHVQGERGILFKPGEQGQPSCLRISIDKIAG